VTLTVVKVGGSFAHTPPLAEILAALVRGAGRTVVVPGGGPFADCVRTEQGRIGFDDQAAHRMALLAMAQFGLALVSRAPELSALVAAASLARVRLALAAGQVPVWLPLDLLDGDPEVPERWEMTSDSLAAWLAGQIGAERLLYLKSVAIVRSLGLADLKADGVLDPLVPEFLGGTHCEAWLCGPDDLAALGAGLADGAQCGQRIRVG
jgi:aspartokinase-like uncharacterized kinase